MTTTPSPKILLVGAGNMAREYAKVLRSLKKNFLVVGRGEKHAFEFKKNTGIKPVIGGLEKWLKQAVNYKIPDMAIVAVNEEQLGPAARLLIKSGIKYILIEKPGGINLNDLKKTAQLANQENAKIFVAYNRRFYASTSKAMEIIKKDGRVSSFTFDFTERSRSIEKAEKTPELKKEWLLANSSHVIDLAFFLGGKPVKIKAYKAGKLDWHPNGSVFCGAGQSDKDALFSYHANWASAGRWGLEIMTPKHKLIFRPLEKLQIQRYGQMEIEEVKLDNRLDLEFKPGLHRLVKSFLANQKNLPTINEQVENSKYFKTIEDHV